MSCRPERRPRSLFSIPQVTDVEREVTRVEFERMTDGSSNPAFRNHRDEFLSLIQDGDIIVEYCTSQSTWEQSMGSYGFNLMRNGEFIDSFVCKMN